VRAQNKCGTNGEWSDAVFYHPKETAGNNLIWKRELQTTKADWDMVRADQCKKKTGERAVGKNTTP